MQNGIVVWFKLRAFLAVLFITALGSVDASAETCQQWLGQFSSVLERLQSEGKAMGDALTAYEAAGRGPKSCSRLDEAMDHGMKTQLAASNLSSPCYELSQFCLSQTPEPIRNVCGQLGAITSSLKTQVEAVRQEKVKTCQ